FACHCVWCTALTSQEPRPDRPAEPAGATEDQIQTLVCVSQELRHARPRGSGDEWRARRCGPTREPFRENRTRTRRPQGCERRTRETYGGTEDPHQAQGL